MMVLEFDGSGGYIFSDEERRAVHGVADLAEPEIRRHLPTLTDRIEVLVQTGVQVIPETGDVGGALAPGRLFWMVDSNNPEGVVPLVRSRFRFTLFHECHHLVRGWMMTGGEPRSSFMDGVVCEGLATAFERDAAGSKPLWGDYPVDVDSWVDELVALPVTAPYAQWMVDHPDGRRWIGYRAGTYIADLAMRSSGRTAAELANTPTEDILVLAGVQ